MGGINGPKIDESLSYPVNALFYKEKGRAHSWLGYHEEALAAYKQALELHPGDPETYAYIADSLEGLDQWDKAKQARKAHDDLQRIINNNSPFF